MNAADGYWWYITINTSAGCEDNLSFARRYIWKHRNGASRNAGRRFEARMYYKSTEDVSFWRNKLSEAMKEFPGVAIEDSGKIETSRGT